MLTEKEIIVNFLSYLDSNGVDLGIHIYERECGCEHLQFEEMNWNQVMKTVDLYVEEEDKRTIQRKETK